MLKSLLQKKRNDEGFTLVELMIVVAIIGVLAALAIYGVSRYLKHSKTAEATRTLGSLETGSKAKYQKETDVSAAKDWSRTDHLFCGVDATDVGGNPQPAAVPLAQKVIGDYSGNVWRCLNFSLNQPQFYQYDYAGSRAGSSNDAKYTAIAKGDLDGNTTTSSFTLTGKVVDGEATRGSLIILNEDE